MKIIKHVIISPENVLIDGIQITDIKFHDLYKIFLKDYPKYFKMDNLSKLGLVAAEIALQKLSPEDKENTSVILFNRNASLITDRNYQATIAEDNYFPSPSLFVYTLANIVTGEIAIRNKIYGETSFYVMEEKNDKEMDIIAKSSLSTSTPRYILYGWVDYNDEKNYLADLKLTSTQEKNITIWKN